MFYEVHNLVFSFLAPAFDTTGFTNSNILYELCRKPAIMDRLRAEIDSHTDWIGSVPSNDDLKDLPYLNAVIHEALRLSPAVGLPL
jgi:cytochrome P450